MEMTNLEEYVTDLITRCREKPDLMGMSGTVGLPDIDGTLIILYVKKDSTFEEAFELTQNTLEIIYPELPKKGETIQ